jgi:RNA recognition motif-containing protein
LQECTVYVENLPPDTTHESLKAKFLEFGPVAYVSIPKFRNSSRVKGFAFVEFESKETVRKVLDSFVGPEETDAGPAAAAAGVDINPASLLRKGDSILFTS